MLAARRVAGLGMLAACLAAAGPEHVRTQIYPNPDFTANALVQTLDGFLWLGGSGLVRFDGLHFHGVAGPAVINALAVARDGGLWIGTDSSLVRYGEGTFVTILTVPVADIAVIGDDLAVTSGRSVLVLRRDGSRTEIPNGADRWLVADDAGNLWFCGYGEAAKGYRLTPGSDRAELVSQGAIATAWDRPKQFARDAAGELWFAQADRVVGVDGGEFTREEKNVRLKPLVGGRNGQLWYFANPITGLSPRVQFATLPIPEGSERTSGLEDLQGNLWEARRLQGLMKVIPSAGWEEWSTAEIGSGAIDNSAIEASGEVIVAAEKGLYRRSSEGWTGPLGPQHRAYRVFPLPDGSLLASFRDLGLVRLSSAGETLEVLSHPSALASNYRELARDSKGRLWAGSKELLLEVVGQLGALSLRPEIFDVTPRQLPAGANPRQQQPVALQTDSRGRFWVGWEFGLAFRDLNGGWHAVATDRELQQIRSFAFGGQGDGDEVWVAYRRKEPFSRLRRKGGVWHVEDFTESQGYGPADTRFLQRDSRGWIWRGTGRGIFVSDGRRFAPHQWLRLDESRGLHTGDPTPYGFTEAPDGSVWLAGDRGIAHITPRREWFQATHQHPPQITRVVAGIREPVLTPPLPGHFEAPLPRLQIDIGSIEAPAFHEAPFLYRLAPLFSDWRPAVNGAIDLRDLAELDYRLEVAYADGPTAPALTYSFTVGSPTHLARWGWWLAGLSLVGFGGLRARRSLWFLKLHYNISRKLHDQDRGQEPGERQPEAAGEVLLNRYELAERLSRSEFADVYRARDRETGSEVAAKILHRRATDAPWVKERFTHEVAALRLVSHPGVVELVDSWILPDGRPCLVTPLLEGPTLRALVTAGTLEAADAAEIVEKVGEALAELHSRGVVHRDVKPENILLCPRQGGWQPVLIDFGNAGLIGQDEAIAGTRLLSGTALYMAPELLNGYYGPATDLYALGAIALEMLAGLRLPDLGCAPGSAEFLVRLRSKFPEPLAARADELAQLLGAALAAHPEERPGNVGLWSATVARVVRGL